MTKPAKHAKDSNSSSDERSYDDDGDEEEEEEEDDLILEGVLVRNPEVPSSDEDEEEDEVGDDDEEEKACDVSQSDINKGSQEYKASSIAQENQSNKNKKKKIEINSSKGKKQDDDSEESDDDNDGKNEDDLVQVDFTFHDMDEKFFHGLKMLLLSTPIYAPFSSALADEMIDNISVGTVVSCDDGGDNVYGFASVLPIVSSSSDDYQTDEKKKKKNHHTRSIAQEQLIQQCMDQCPEQYKTEMNIVTSGSTQRPAGIFLHGRMVNLPLEITLVLHEQLVLDIDWAIEHAEGGEIERKKLDFGAFVLLAPCYLDPVTQKVTYKHFDDEIFANCAEFVYTIHHHHHTSVTTTTNSSMNKKRNHSQSKTDSNIDDSTLTNVIVLTKTGHRQGMKDMNELVHGRTFS